MLTIGPLGELIRCWIVTEIRRAPAHDEAEHHLRVAILAILVVERKNHQKFL
jgi:hypothetical protein